MEYEPMTDDEVRALGYEPTENGWTPIGTQPHPAPSEDPTAEPTNRRSVRAKRAERARRARRAASPPTG